MRNRAAPTTAVTTAARGPERPERQVRPDPPAQPSHPERPSDRVFGLVAEPDRRGAGVRGQDVELFDAPVTPPPVTTRAAAPSAAPRRSRQARRPAPHARRSASLPLVVTGALSAGLAGALVVWLSGGPEAGPEAPPALSLPLPDLATAAAPRAIPSSDAPASPGAGTPAASARTTPSETPAISSAAPSSSTAPYRPPATPAPAPTPTTTPPPPPSPSHRPQRSSRPSRPGAGDLAVGSTGPEVADLQRRLQRLSLYLGSADGVFTEYVGEALGRFQIARNIPERPGVYGPLTRSALRAETD
ncbi:peptidoglycan-binding protein [Streptomyces sp. NPDC127584]|uniref:peptidoglycan-binding domain-containing protein n=1 Tax=Streptomyces sp. NPDC127584 TaxID=3345403 RepID=UPI00362D88F8